MNCQEFSTMLDALASGRPVEASRRDQALAHAGCCAGCGLRLQNERIVNAGLQALAEDTRTEPSPQLKQSLRAAFAVHHAQKPAAVLAFPTGPRRTRLVVTVAAAAVLALLALTSLFWLQTKQAVEPQQAGTKNPAPPVTVTPTPDKTAEATATPAPAPVAEVASQPARKVTRRAPRRVMTSDDDTANEQTATQFIPLTYISDAAAVQSGLVVRVEVPRATLVAMGLPVNAARGDTLIRADVIMGDDGVARAIRFVQ